jgi:HK97 family phage major capsid protein
MEFEIKGLEKEAAESLQKALGELTEDMQKEVKSILEGYAGKEAVEELKSLIEKQDTSKQVEELKSQLNELDGELQKAQKAFSPDSKEAQTLEEGLKNLMASEDFKSAKKSGFRDGNTFEIKADTGDITGTVNMTRQNLSVKFDPERALAFLPYLNTGTLGQNQNEILWMEGTYTSNVGYVSEGTGQATGDAGTATEKTRKMSKISAKLLLTAEMLEDANYIASAFRMKMQEKYMLWLDGEVYDGDGSDGVNPQHIYGIQGQATAFDAATSGSAGTVADANIGDLVDSVLLQARQAEQNGINRIWMNPLDFFKLRTTKDKDGNRIFIKDVNGNYTIAGLPITTTSKVAANTMLAADTSKVQLWWKRNPEVKFTQVVGTDMEDDVYRVIMFMRNQLVVEGPDKTALIYVSDIEAAITAIESVAA